MDSSNATKAQVLTGIYPADRLRDRISEEACTWMNKAKDFECFASAFFFSEFGSICNAIYLVVTWLRVRKQVSFSISVVYTSWTASQQGALLQLSACRAD